MAGYCFRSKEERCDPSGRSLVVLTSSHATDVAGDFRIGEEEQPARRRGAHRGSSYDRGGEVGDGVVGLVCAILAR
jgi:hypothetical protein